MVAKAEKAATVEKEEMVKRAQRHRRVIRGMTVISAIVNRGKAGMAVEVAMQDFLEEAVLEETAV